MKAVKVILAGEGDEFEFDLNPNEQKPNEQKPEEKKPNEQNPEVKAKVEITSEVPADPTNVTIPAYVLEELVTQLRDAKAGKTVSSPSQSNVNDDLLRRLADAISNNSSDGRQMFRALKVEEIDVDDIMELPAIFFSTAFKYSIYDDQLHGRTIATPYNKPIKFKTIRREVTGQGRKVHYANVSAAYINSKREAEFLRKHSLFGITFFENLGNTKTVDVRLQEKIVSCYNTVKTFTNQELVARCISANIEIDTNDMGELRRRLANKMAESLMKSEDSKARTITQDLDTFMQNEQDRTKGSAKRGGVNNAPNPY